MARVASGPAAWTYSIAPATGGPGAHGRIGRIGREREGAARRGARAEDEGHEVPFVGARAKGDVDEAEPAALTEPRPVGGPHGGDGAPLAPEPPLARQEAGKLRGDRAVERLLDARGRPRPRRARWPCSRSHTAPPRRRTHPVGTRRTRVARRPRPTGPPGSGGRPCRRGSRSA